jgi:hypothetical protein
MRLSFPEHFKIELSETNGNAIAIDTGSEIL